MSKRRRNSASFLRFLHLVFHHIEKGYEYLILVFAVDLQLVKCAFWKLVASLIIFSVAFFFARDVLTQAVAESSIRAIPSPLRLVDFTGFGFF